MNKATNENIPGNGALFIEAVDRVMHVYSGSCMHRSAHPVSYHAYMHILEYTETLTSGSIALARIEEHT